METDKGKILKQENYSVEVKYSPEAIEKKLMKFISKNGDEFVISAEEMISILMNQVNNELLSPLFVDVERVNVVTVLRQIKCVLTQDMKAGQELLLNYTHPYPLEFALLEEVYKIAKIEQGLGVTELTKELIDETKAKIQPQAEEFVKKFYKSYKNINLGSEAGK